MCETTPTIRLLSIVEASTLNAVARNVLGFYRSARELKKASTDLPDVEGSLVTFERRPEDSQSPNEFVITGRALDVLIDVIPERRRFDLSVIPALRRTVTERRPDIVVTHSVKSHFLLWRSRIWKEYPWVAFHHGYTDTDRKMRVYNRLDRWSLPKADRLITVCQAFARELASATAVPIEKISIQYNSIDPEPKPSPGDVQGLRNRLGISPEERIILAVGRLSKEKGHVLLIEAFKLLGERNPELACKLIIVGDGPERGRLEAAAESFGLRDRVTFAGQTGNVPLFYAAADLMALPSHSEGSPIVLLEAMAANLPVVATSVGGVPEMVKDNESALLVPPSDPQAMTAAITRVLTDTGLAERLTKNAAALVATRYTPENYVRNLIGIYSEIIAGRKAH